MACDAFSECIMNSVTREADCLCKPGYVGSDGLPCQSLCELEPNMCVNGGKCEIASEKGAVCGCPVSRNWLYRGERCAKFAPETLSLIICVASALSSLLLVFLLIQVAVKLRRECKNSRSMDGISDVIYLQNAIRDNPVYGHDDAIHCSVPCNVATSVLAAGLTDPVYTSGNAQFGAQRSPDLFLEEIQTR